MCCTHCMYSSDWKLYTPKTNVLWLHYVLVKIGQRSKLSKKIASRFWRAHFRALAKDTLDQNLSARDVLFNLLLPSTWLLEILTTFMFFRVFMQFSSFHLSFTSFISLSVQLWLYKKIFKICISIYVTWLSLSLVSKLCVWWRQWVLFRTISSFVFQWSTNVTSHWRMSVIETNFIHITTW